MTAIKTSSARRVTSASIVPVKAKQITFKQLLKAYNLGPIEVQRDHDTRVHTAKHLRGNLLGFQYCFSFVTYKGQLRLLDGYTRVKAILAGLMEAPTHVLALIHQEVASQKEVVKLYDQIDNPKTGKKAPCRFSEGLRMTHLLGTFSSQLLLKLPKSAPMHATGADSVREGVVLCKKGLKWLDSLGLKKGERTLESLGSIAAYLAIGSYHDRVPAGKAEKFVMNLNASMFAPRELADAAIVEFREFHVHKAKNGALGCGANVAAILGRALYHYLQFVGIDHEAYTQAPTASGIVTVEDFKAIMEAQPKIA